MADHDFRSYFQTVVEDGKEKVECTLCGRVIVNNVGCMRMHYTKVHGRDQLPSHPRRVEDSECSEDDDDERSYVSDTECNDAAERILKYLAVCPRSRTFDAVIRDAPDGVIEAICNAAVKVKQLEVPLTESQKELFRSNRPLFQELTSPTSGISRKRKVIESQHGGFLPILISAALGALASHLFGSS